MQSKSIGSTCDTAVGVCLEPLRDMVKSGCPTNKQCADAA